MGRTSILYGGRKAHFLLLITAVCLFAVSESVFAAVPAFPGAEGSGRWATGGRGGDIYEVNNLTNDANIGSGSIVDAVSEPNRTIVFTVSGTIELNGVILEPKSNTTIAGQTAPGDGICIKGRIHIRSFVHDIIIRYIRVRVDAGGANASGDAVDIDEGSNIIIDHVTASYSLDEGISCQEDSNDVTVQWCIISEALTYQSHSYGSLIRGQYGQEKTYHHNLYAHNNSRNPRPGTYLPQANDPEGLHFDFRNNVAYNWKSSVSGYNDDGSGSNVLGVSRYNFIGNAFIPGPESTSTSTKQAFRERCKVAYGYFADNSYDGVVSSDPWKIVKFDSGYMTSTDIAAYKARSYLLPMEPVNTTWPDQAKYNVLANAGASFPKRDIIDTRIVNDVINKTGSSIRDMNYQPEGGWPMLNSLPAPADTDHDGMPDTWETTYGLNLNDANDRNNYDLYTGYTNLEVYLNSLLGFDVTPPSARPQVVWTQRYNGTANNSDYAKDIAVDSTGNVIVTGYAKNTGTNYDFATIKYTPDGSIIWTNTYNRSSSNSDYAMALAVDANSNVIVAGYGYIAATGYDGIIIKYAPGGSQLWTAAYNYSNDRFYDVATDANGNIYAVGRSGDDALLVKYTPDGNLAWARTYNGSANNYDSFYQLALDANGNVYACGESAELYTDQDCLTAKYSPDGVRLWVQTYDGPANGWDLLEAITLDSTGNVYVAGSIETETDSNYVTIKYSPDGDSLWTAFYGGGEYGWDEAYAITVDSGGDAVVTGYSEGAASPSDIATVKYNSATGSEIWAKRYAGAGNFTDFAEAIATDNSGNVYVHGRSVEVNSTDYVTICYQSDGTELWKMNYDGPAMLTDIGNAMVLDGNSVYVTGYSMNSAGNYDYATVKYTTTPVNPCPAPPAGDLNGDCQVDFSDFLLMADSYDGSTGSWLILKDIADTWLECGLTNPADCWQ
ncbi:MAG: hypothetical protein WCE45_02845 [Sedimentisphaerales bacterium]